jgi:hypothetical protein
MEMRPCYSFEVLRLYSGMNRKIEVFPRSVCIPGAPTYDREGAFKLGSQIRPESRRFSVNYCTSETRIADNCKRVTEQDTHVYFDILQAPTVGYRLNQFPKLAFAEQLEAMFVRHATHPSDISPCWAVSAAAWMEYELAGRIYLRNQSKSTA